MGRPTGITVRDRIAQLAARARAGGAPREAVDAAGRVALRRFGGGSHLLRGSDLTRIDGYYMAVVRNRAVRECRDSEYVQRLVASSAVADLRASGRDDLAVCEALESSWAHALDAHVIERARAALCG